MRTINLFTNLSFICVVSILSSLVLSQCSPEEEACFFIENTSITQSKSLPSFSKISTHLDGHYVIRQGKEYHVEIQGDKSYVERLSTQVHDETLRLESTHPFCESNPKFQLIITLPLLKVLTVHSKSEVYLENFKNQESLEINLGQESHLEINQFEGIKKMDVTLSPQAEVISKRETTHLDSLTLRIEGEGRFLGYKSPADVIDISIQGKGLFEVKASKKLNVVIYGEGNVYCQGMPNLYKRITGKGNVYFTS